MNLFKKCPECNRLFAMKKTGEELVATEDINMVDVLYRPGPRGTIEPLGEEVVRGERKVYETTYVCKFCGAGHTDIKYKNIKK